MPKMQYWVLSGSCVAAGLLFLMDIPFTLWLQSDSRELRGMNLLIQQGEQCQALWQKVALRADQLGQQDPGLKLVLSNQHINITPASAGTAAPASAPAPAPSPLAPPANP